MECEHGEYDNQNMIYICNIINDECIFSMPDHKVCCEIFGDEEK